MTELNFALMEAEPTLAAITPEDETQSLHAWSQEDAAVAAVVTYRPRSWKSPLMLIAAVAALLSAGFVVYKVNDAVDGGPRNWNEVVNPNAENPQVAPSHPSIASSPPVAVQSPDQRFIALLKQRGQTVIAPDTAIRAAHAVCTAESQGKPDPQIAAELVASTAGSDMKMATVFLYTAQSVYCP